MQIFVKLDPGKALVVNVSYADTINDLKDKIYKMEGIPPHIQRLTFDGQVLEGSRALTDFNIKNESIVQLRRLLPYQGKAIPAKPRPMSPRPPIGPPPDRVLDLPPHRPSDNIGSGIEHDNCGCSGALAPMTPPLPPHHRRPLAQLSAASMKRRRKKAERQHAAECATVALEKAVEMAAASTAAARRSEEAAIAAVAAAKAAGAAATEATQFVNDAAAAVAAAAAFMMGST